MGARTGWSGRLATASVCGIAAEVGDTADVCVDEVATAIEQGPKQCELDLPGDGNIPLGGA